MALTAGSIVTCGELLACLTFATFLGLFLGLIAETIDWLSSA